MIPVAVYIGFVWQGSGSGGVFCERLPEASPRPTEPVPGGSRTVPLPARAERIRSGSNGSSECTAERY